MLQGDPTLLKWSIPRSSAGVTDVALIIAGRAWEMKTRQAVPRDALPDGAVGVAPVSRVDVAGRGRLEDLAAVDLAGEATRRAEDRGGVDVERPRASDG